MGDVGELVLRNAELLCQNCPVTLGLGQQDHKIRVVQNGLNLPAGQKVFDVLRQSLTFCVRAEGTQPFLRSIFHTATK